MKTYNILFYSQACKCQNMDSTTTNLRLSGIYSIVMWCLLNAYLWFPFQHVKFYIKPGNRFKFLNCSYLWEQIKQKLQISYMPDSQSLPLQVIQNLSCFSLNKSINIYVSVLTGLIVKYWTSNNSLHHTSNFHIFREEEQIGENYM